MELIASSLLRFCCIGAVIAMSTATALSHAPDIGLFKYDISRGLRQDTGHPINDSRTNSKSEQCPFFLQAHHPNHCSCSRISLEIRCEHLENVPNFTNHSTITTGITWNGIQLDRQLLRDVGAGAFRNTQTRRITLNFNLLTLGLHTDSFLGQETTLRELYLGGCRLRSPPPELISGLTQLQYLHLWGNEIEDIPWGFFDGSYNLRELELWENKIEEIGTETFRALRRLKRLDLYNNRISVLGRNAFGRVTELESLNLGKNSIHALDADTFSQLTNLKSLRLDQNRIKYVHSDAFFRLKNLIYLSLSNNLINFLLDDVFINLSRLVYLTLERNALEYAWTRTFDGLGALRFLYLSHNSLVNLPEGIFRESPRLDHLFIDGNQLRTIHRCIMSDVTRLRTLSIIGNTIPCDCRTDWMRDLLLRAGTSVWGSCSRLDDVTANPLQLQGNGTDDADIWCSAAVQRC